MLSARPTDGAMTSTLVSPKDILANVIDSWAFRPETLIHDVQNLPYPIAGTVQVQAKLLA